MLFQQNEIIFTKQQIYCQTNNSYSLMTWSRANLVFCYETKETISLNIN